MRAVQAACAHWPAEAVHSEHFGADLAPPPTPPADGLPASLTLRRSDRSVPVAPGQTILQALRGAGVACNSSCEAGLCGECRLNYLSGLIEHNDYLLSDEERADSVLICCARVREGAVVLDI
ncbi:flavin reductase family protein [Achromobacter xylosoxidans]